MNAAFAILLAFLLMIAVCFGIATLAIGAIQWWQDLEDYGEG